MSSATGNLVSNLIGLSGPQASVPRAALFWAADIWMNSLEQEEWFLIQVAVSDWDEMHSSSGGPPFLSGQRTSAGAWVSTYKWKLLVIPVFAASIFTFGWNTEVLHSDRQVSQDPYGQDNAQGAGTLSALFRRFCCLITRAEPAEPQTANRFLWSRLWNS